MAIVIPMAGLGSRFATEGYRLPKPLIPVSGEPMIFSVIDDLPESDTWIFIVREEHVEEYDIDTLLKSKVSDAEIVTVAETTEGQVCTTMLAEPHLDPNEELLIAACDHGLLYENSEFQELRSRDDVDAIAWTFTEQRSLELHPESWGWCELADDGETTVDISVKTPISDDPYHDHAITGAFYFDRAADFLDAAELMIDADHRVNGEFYADHIPTFLRRMNKRSVIFDVDLYISWGTPRNLYLYEEMEYLCKHGIELPESNDATDKRSLWEAYFDD
jgi:NDP-sugar pyrophosphorylase family protein